MATSRIIALTDMRGSLDKLALAARERLGQDPRWGALFCFANKRANRLKILWWDKTGYCILYKRMHQAVVALPGADGGSCSLRIDGRQLQMLLAGASKPPRRRKRDLTPDRKSV